MNILALIPGMLLGLTALIIIIYCAWLLLRNVPALKLRGRWEERILNQRKQILLKARALLKEARYQDCYPLLYQSFVLEHVKSAESMADRVLEHHLAVLNAIIGFSEKYPVSLSNLPVIEELLQVRAALCKAFLESLAAVKKLGSKSADELRSGPPPKWAINAFVEKTEELQTKIETNRKSLESEIDKLFHRISHSAELSEVTYH